VLEEVCTIFASRKALEELIYSFAARGLKILGKCTPWLNPIIAELLE